MLACCRDRPQTPDPGEAGPPTTALTDTWYRTSEVHTSSSPTTHGMASVRPFRSFRAWGEERCQKGTSFPLLPPKSRRRVCKGRCPGATTEKAAGPGRGRSVCSPGGSRTQPLHCHFLSHRKVRPAMPGFPGTKKDAKKLHLKFTWNLTI